MLWWLYEGPSRVETKTVTLDCGRYHGGICKPRIGMPSAHQRPFNEGYRFLLDVVKRYVYSRYLLGSRLVFAEYLCQVLQAGRLVRSLPSAVGELLIHVTTLFRGRCCLYSTITQPSMRWLLLSAQSSLPRTCHVMLCCSTQFKLCKAPIILLLLNVFCPALSAAHVVTCQICKFSMPARRRS